MDYTANWFSGTWQPPTPVATPEPKTVLKKGCTVCSTTQGALRVDRGGKHRFCADCDRMMLNTGIGDVIR